MELDTVSTEELISTLYTRGITTEQIFSQYYAMEEIQSHISQLTVGDAELAGMMPDTGPTGF